MSRAFGITLGLCALAYSAPAFAVTVYISGNYGGFHEYSGVDVVVNGDLLLTSSTHIRVKGGSITVDALIYGNGADGTDGVDGDNSIPIEPTPGANGVCGWDLTLETLPGPRLADPVDDDSSPSSDPTPVPSLGYRGSIVVNYGIELKGGRGGHGGDGDNPYDDFFACIHRPGQDGEPGGAGGCGGDFLASSCKDILFQRFYYAGSVDTAGGDGGDGGVGGGYTIIEQQDEAGDGAHAGQGGAAGTMTLQHNVYAAAVDVIKIDEGCALQGAAGDGGAGGYGGSALIIAGQGDFTGGIPGDGGNGGHGGLGGDITITGKNVLRGSTGTYYWIYLVNTGGYGGRSGDGGHSGGGNCACGCDFNDPCFGWYGGTGGQPGNGGSAGDITVTNTANGPITLPDLRIHSYGGWGGDSGYTNYSGGDVSGNCLVCANPYPGVDAPHGGGVGGHAGALTFTASATTGIIDVSGAWIRGEGNDAGDGGRGGDAFSSDSGNCDPCVNCQPGGDGSDGGIGGNGSTIALTAWKVIVEYAELHIDGGYGGNAGGGGRYRTLGKGDGGEGGAAGTDGHLVVTATQYLSTGLQIVDDPQAAGQDGADGSDCPDPKLCN